MFITLSMSVREILSRSRAERTRPIPSTNALPDLTGQRHSPGAIRRNPGDTALGVRLHGEQVGHEIGHFLLEYLQIDDLNPCSREHTPDTGSYADRVMFRTVGFRGSFTDAERDNIWAVSNPYNPWIEHFLSRAPALALSSLHLDSSERCGGHVSLE